MVASDDNQFVHMRIEKLSKIKLSVILLAGSTRCAKIVSANTTEPMGAEAWQKSNILLHGCLVASTITIRQHIYDYMVNFLKARSVAERSAFSYCSMSV